MSENKTEGFQAADLSETDADVFASAMGKDLADEPVEQQVEETPAEPEHEPEAGEHEEPDDQGEEGESRGRDDQGRFKRPESQAERGLRGELIAERNKRQATEAAFEQFRKDNEARFKDFEARLKPVQTEQKAPVDADPAPDMFLDPQGYAAWQDRAMQRRFDALQRQTAAERVGSSFQAAHEELGAVFQEAHAAAEKLDPNDPVAKQQMQRVMASPNPGKALVAWHKQQKALAEIGNDPSQYRSKVATELMKDPEFRKQFLAELNNEARGGQGSSRTTQFPPSLNDSSGGPSSLRGTLSDTSDRSFFEDAMRG